MNIIFNIQGGLGKSIMATAVCKAIKKQYPDSFLIVISSYKDVFLNNKNVDKVLNHQEQNQIYKKYIKGMLTLFMVSDPYTTDEYLNESDHLIKIWCKMNDIPYNGEKPEFYLSKAEIQFYSEIYKTPKPILALQTNGGAQTQGTIYNWSRDLPKNIVEKLIEKLHKRYTIVHIKRPDQQQFENTLQAHDNYRSIAYLLSISEKSLLIDSFAQHLAKAMGKKSVVCWIGTNSKVFGYDSNINIHANKPTKEVNDDHANYMKYNLVEQIHHIPYNNLNEIFDINSLYNALKA